MLKDSPNSHLEALPSKELALQGIYDETLASQLNLTQEDINMATITDFAKGFEPSKTRNISELKEIPTSLELVDDEFTADKGKETEKIVKQKVVVINNEKYRVPMSVIADLKAIIEKNPNLEKFSVTKKGTGLQTRYTVIPL
jgi:spore coat polysaccharide biosynthesis predicted glycosyltransferase SpsG